MDYIIDFYLVDTRKPYKTYDGNYYTYHGHQTSIQKYEEKMVEYTKARFKELDFINLQGTSSEKGGIFSFTIKQNKLHPHDISTIIDQKGVAVRAGHHCAQPLLDYLGLS